MDVLEELKNLDTNDPGRWPLPFRIAAIVIIFVLVFGGGTYYLVYKKKQPELEIAQNRENELKSQFESDQRKAANLGAYKEQLEQIRSSFGTMLRQLPGETEIPSLIVDISQTGLGAGLEERLFETQPENPKGFYAEKPINIRLSGSYHEIARFASQIAALPRIVTLHDIKLRPTTNQDIGRPGANRLPNDDLVFDVIAKTYRYLDEESSQ
ncbi:MAG: type 4a pilus biogenesis protein PilO [Pseudomonadota bacterium]